MAFDHTLTKIKPSQDAASAAGNIKVTTSSTGTTFVTLAARQIVNLTVSNTSGTPIEFQQDGAGDTFVIPANTIYTIKGLDDASRIGFRRADVGNTQVSFGVRWER